ncbi:MAG: lantibiotic immunity ABC transporter MutE/EpiE family permease subunit [Acetobacterium sp.]
MIAIIKSEFQKSKGSSVNQFVILAPIAVLILGYFLGGGQNGAYNWWVVLFFPALIPILSSIVINREKNLGYKGLFLFPKDKAFFWIAKNLYLSLLLIFSSSIFMVGILILGFLDKPTISFKANLLATGILILTFLFQIPICMFLADQFNLFVATLFNLGMVILSVVSFGTGSIIRFSPYGVGVALMCPILYILPNGLPVPEGSPLLVNDSILSAGIGCCFLYVLFAGITALAFRNREGK